MNKISPSQNTTPVANVAIIIISVPNYIIIIFSIKATDSIVMKPALKSFLGTVQRDRFIFLKTEETQNHSILSIPNTV